MSISAHINPHDVPIRVVDLEIGGSPRLRPAAGRACSPGWNTGHLLALVRLHGHPIGLVRVDVPPGCDALHRLVAAARAELTSCVDAGSGAGESTAAAEGSRASKPPASRPPGLAAPPPSISVVVATRDRPVASLARCLDSVTRVAYPRARYEVIVVDNDPSTDTAERLVRERYAATVTYTREPLRGLSMAHNRGIEAASGQIIAFTDDDVVVDGRWLTAIAAGFASGEGVGCVTGLVVPAELETPAQALLEQHGGYAKGFEQRRYDLHRPCGDPLFPFTTAQLGAGANAAFRSEAIREVGGYDPAIGAGSVARAGDELLAFFRILVAGYGIVYQPDAVVWHHHRRTEQDLATQAIGYGIGLGAYLTAALVHEPRMFPTLLRRLPVAVMHAASRYRRTPETSHEADDGWTSRLMALELQGLLRGPVAYARSRRHVRRVRAQAGPLPLESGRGR
jgi:GT2 family glycosyltransferase